MDRKELIKKYIKFFKSKKHKEIPNVSLIPENDPTVLFTTAGMHPLVPYLIGQSHPLGKRLVNVQKCIRTTDIEEVGDAYHHTFLEMLGNWSLGEYWKKESIEYSFEFLTKVLKISAEKLAVTCFKGDGNIPKDKESVEIWKSLGIPKEKIGYLREDNWWGPAGRTGPCGPSTEIFYGTGKEFNPNYSTLATDGSDWVEIWNNVFMEYNKDEKGKIKPAKQRNVDTGMGVERTLAILNNLEDNYLTEVWKPIIKEIEKLSKKKYKGNEKAMRIIADHIKASCFILAEGITPSNTEQGYVLRRLIRRAIKYGKDLGMRDFTAKVAETVFDIYPDYFPKKDKKIRFVNRDNRTFILDEIDKEESKFEITLERGLNKFKKYIKNKRSLSGTEAFLLYQSFGFPIEMIEEEAKKNKVKFNVKDFKKTEKAHQKLSRTASRGKFKSGLADHSETTTKLHTAAHLLLAALRIILKDKNIIQKGSNITPERIRLDFSFPRKLTELELKEVENLVNRKIKESIDVIKEEMSLEEAKENLGALGNFEEKYGNKVSVYIINNFSKEICAGPHVKNTSELGYFKIIKEESSSSGVRRIKAVLK